jgi:coproporphyrinogen III oxidase-like Fe-S oxidoreductase
MLGLRLDQPVPLAEVATAVDAAALRRLTALGLAARRGNGLVLTSRGRFLGGAVTAELLAW